ncbi:hypothetical protein P153DRAFT_401447 [Dothidotthia symphoricarpi CBS 119687]|uniref:Beta-ketoacyl synthase C-terminal domain-containing protein n=1 Tax=Dothidotthia symphoricarpi CBS 119687 TaxID=1392245 RepID=A0A6A5ZYB0_9PLEO|nr:uncharacterized protein P153DRAFT_401447 [Dothidotthia symphoricarpi CBS 119687]KAF2123884.1 hypothetical protein P153DRAFT_401447 [Dothidotthia symphoricarpi CBS 119687]
MSLVPMLFLSSPVPSSSSGPRGRHESPSDIVLVVSLSKVQQVLSLEYLLASSPNSDASFFEAGRHSITLNELHKHIVERFPGCKQIGSVGTKMFSFREGPNATRSLRRVCRHRGLRDGVLSALNTATIQAAGITPKTIRYVELHDSGTRMGAALEVSGLGRALDEVQHVVHVGSNKAGRAESIVRFRGQVAPQAGAA